LKFAPRSFFYATAWWAFYRLQKPSLLFSSFSAYSKHALGLSPSPPLVTPWFRSRAWKIKAPEFDDDPPSPPSQLVVPRYLSSFGEFARLSLGITSSPPMYFFYASLVILIAGEILSWI
jgi:hypothetical protein